MTAGSQTGLLVEGTAISIGARLGRGGEGDVHALAGHDDSAVKLYTLADLGERDRKIPAMVRRGFAAAAPQVAFPRAVVHDRAGRFRGFTMPRAPAGRPIHDLYGVASRRQAFPEADFRFLLHVAINVARAVGAVHAAGCVIGDINHSGFLVGPKGIVTVIDADSFQFDDGAERFLCRVGVPDYTPPELQGRSLNGIVRTPDHDAFGLAVLLFQLLFLGRHPFAGVPLGADLDTPAAIAGHHFAYSTARRVGLRPPPRMLRIDAHGRGIAALFEAAFAPVGSTTRPGPDRWLDGLIALRGDLKRCATVPEHYHAAAARDCPWCAIEKSAPGVVLFLTPFRPGTASQGGGMPPFDVAAMRARITALGLPERFSHADALGRPAGGSAAAPRTGGLLSWFMDVFGPGRRARRDLAAIDAKLVAAIGAVNDRVDLDGLWTRATDLARLVADRDTLARDYAHAETVARQQMHRTALMAFLDLKLLKNQSIKGIGPSLKTVLASFGVETAADVRREGAGGLQRVPGIGPVKAGALRDWMVREERRFSPPTRLDARHAAELAKRRARLVERARTLEGDMRARLDALAADVKRIGPLSRVPDPHLLHLLGERTRLAAEVERHGRAAAPMPIPSSRVVRDGIRRAFTEALRAKPASSASASTPPKPSLASSIGTPACPVCGGAMVRRVARRGPRRGRPFFGCSRWPGCTGTRSIP